MFPLTSNLRTRSFAALGAAARAAGALPAFAAVALLLAASLPLSAQSDGTRRPRAATTSGIQQLALSGDLRSLKRSEMISQGDVERSPRGYRLSVPGVGNIYVKGLRTPRGSKECHVHEPSLVKLLAADPPAPLQTKWMQLTIYDCPWGTCCLGPLGGGCYVIVSR